MKHFSSLSLLAIPLVLIFCSTLCKADEQRIDKRQKLQRARILHGAGEYTADERRRMRRGDRRIRMAERKAKADGQVSSQEAKHINRMQNRQSRKIRRFKNNERK